MAKDHDTKLQFITMRAEGLSYDAIAKELSISKQTLIEWGAIYSDEVEQLQYEAFIKIKEKFARGKLDRYEKTLQMLEKIDNHIINDIDLSRANPKDLMQLKITLEQQLKTIEQSTRLKTQYTQDMSGITVPIEGYLSKA